MYLAYNIAVHERPSEEVTMTVRSIMRSWNFDLVSDEVAAQALKMPAVDVLPEFDETLVFRKFLISPYSNKSCMVYPSTGWFSEVQDLSVELSKKLGCIALALLIDDSKGWGFELSQKGQVADRFHTKPMKSPMLSEKQDCQTMPTPDQMTKVKRHMPGEQSEDEPTSDQELQAVVELDQILNISPPLWLDESDTDQIAKIG